MYKALFIQYTNPAAYPPLRHAISILLESGWAVECLGIDPAATSMLRLPKHANLRVHMRVQVRPGFLQKLHYVNFCLLALWRAVRWRPDLVYASDALSTPAGLAASLFSRRNCLYHEHDTRTRAHTTFQRIVDRARLAFCRKASLIVFPNAFRAKDLMRETGLPANRLVTVFNCASRTEILTSQVRQLPDSDSSTKIWLYFHGSICPERLPIHFVDALKLLPARLGLRVVGYEAPGSAGYCREIQVRALELDLDSRVEVLGPLNRAELLAKARQSHIGISLVPIQSDDINMQFMAGASNKPFDYLACGCPLIVSDLPEWREMFVDTGVAVSCDPGSLQSIVTAIRTYLDSPAQYEQAQSNGFRMIDMLWNYESQFAPVLDSINASAARRP